MSRFAFNPEISSGAHFTPSGGEAAATTAIDAHRAAVFQPGIESHAAAIAPGAEQSIMTAMQAAAQPISPLIQMIMRMPGQIGLLSSMFEALGNFIMGHADLLAAFDPSILAGAHSALTSLPGGEHMGINLSLLPHGAPIFQNLHGLGSLGNNGADMLGAAKGGTQFSTPDILKDSVAFRDQLKVSGSLDLNKPQFETGRGLSSQVDGLSQKGDALSGPAMRETSTANQLAGANRLFGDRPVALTSHSPLSTSTPSVASGMSQTVPIAAQNAVPSSFNVNGSAFNSSDVSAAGSMSDAAPAAAGSQNVGFNINQLGKQAIDSSTTSSVGPSGGVSDQLGTNKFVAMDKGVATFHPTLGTAESSTGYDAGYLQHQTPTEAATSSHNLGGLKAKELSLDSVKDATKAHAAPVHSTSQTPTHAAPAHAKPAVDQVSHSKPVMDHIGHQTAGSSHNHSASYNGRDGIAHTQRGPVHTAQPRISAQPAAQQQMYKSSSLLHRLSPDKAADASGVAVDQIAPNQQMAAADAAQAPQVAADGSHVADGTQLTQAGDATQVPATGDAAQATPTAPSTYTIRAGDCLWNIAKDQLGAPTRWSEIYKMNADVLGSNPSLIHPGTNINIPGSGGEVASGLEHGTYIVKAGDNLWDISKHFTGDGSKWGEIYKLNQDVIGSNPSLILPGQELHMPGMGAESAGTLAQAPAAAATQQLAQGIPQAGGMPASPAGDLRVEGGTPLTAESALPQTPVQSYAPTELQAQAAPAAAPEAAMEMPQTPATAPMAQAQAASAPAQAVGGPGAAAAATLPPQPTPAELHQMAAAKNDGIVSSNMTADLSQFIRKAK
jgi:LysM repeat protein